MIRNRIIWLAIILLNSYSVMAEVSNIQVVGLFNGMAIVKFNQQQTILKVGKTDPSGMTLVSATANEAVINIHGQQYHYQLSGEVGEVQAHSVGSKKTHSIWRVDGRYTTQGSINQKSVTFIVDTGATTIALNSYTAKRLALAYQEGRRVPVTTASGEEMGYVVQLAEIKIGDIMVRNIDAIVLEGAYPREPLLGMTFLEKVKISQHDGRMDLEPMF